MEQSLFYLTILLFICKVYGNASELPCGDMDWTQYENEKCFKLIDKLITHDEAEAICKRESLRNDSHFSLIVSIKTTAEQEFIKKYLYDKYKLFNNVWIGAKRRSKSQFVWDDGSNIEFTNWAEGSPSEEAGRDCVEINSKETKQFSNKQELNQSVVDGKWSDVHCKKKNFVLCEKSKIWSFSDLQKTLVNVIDDLRDTKKEMKITKNNLDILKKESEYTSDLLVQTRIQLEDTRNKLNSTSNLLTNTINELSITKNFMKHLKQNPVPIGFIYTQLPFQLDPRNIWPLATWQEISSKYAGLFFRVLGQNSMPFGKIQAENIPKIDKAYYEVRGHQFGSKEINFPSSGSTNYLKVGGHVKNSDSIKFRISGGEIRPRNQAVRIWKRTK